MLATAITIKSPSNSCRYDCRDREVQHRDRDADQLRYLAYSLYMLTSRDRECIPQQGCTSAEQKKLCLYSKPLAFRSSINILKLKLTFKCLSFSWTVSVVFSKNLTAMAFIISIKTGAQSSHSTVEPCTEVLSSHRWWKLVRHPSIRLPSTETSSTPNRIRRLTCFPTDLLHWLVLHFCTSYTACRLSSFILDLNSIETSIRFVRKHNKDRSCLVEFAVTRWLIVILLRI